MKALDSIWFTPMGGPIIGIVAVETDEKVIQYYIGTASGHDEVADENHIAQHGARFPASIAGPMFFPIGVKNEQNKTHE